MSPLVPDFILQKDALGETEGTFTAAVLIIDIAGFTDITEKLMEHGRAGAETLARTLRFYFDPLIAAVHQAGGFIIGFAGDAFTALFPDTSQRKVAEYALSAAISMRRFVEEHRVYECEVPSNTEKLSFNFSVRLGLSWGSVEWRIVKVADTRAYYHFFGPAIESCVEIEHLAQRDEILLDSAFCDLIPPATAKAAPNRRSGVYWVGDARLPSRPDVPREPPPGDGSIFLPSSVHDIPRDGEFRNVTSVFLAFDHIPDFDELTRLLYELSQLFGGTFTGIYSGDLGISALIHFGAPIAHENDNDRALDFALELKKRGLRSMRLRAGITRDVRYTGFNGGTERLEFACLGRATNLAARLVMKAPWSAIWADEQVFRASETNYQWQTENIFRFKGFDLPVLVYSLERRRISVQKEFNELGLVIGREADLEQLSRDVDPIFDGKPAGLIYIDGEAGLGKSYLVQRFRHKREEEQGERPFLWIDARCDQTLQSSLNAFEFALKDYFWESSAIGKEEKQTNFDDAFEYLMDRLPETQIQLKRELEKARSVFAALIGIRWDDSPYERLHPKLRHANTLSALSYLFLAECSLQPVILHFEDAHWADEESIEAIRALARSCKGLPLAIIVTARRRDDGTPVRLPLDGIPQRVIELKPLSREQLLAMAVPFFGGPMPDMLATLLVDTAGGNPFFAQEILAYWLEDGRYGQSSSSISISNTFMPPKNVNSLLISRLDRLDAKVKQTVVAAAVLGREFDLRVLVRMLPDPSVLEQHIRIGEGQCIWSAMSEHRFQFSNALLRNAAYEMQARARLQQLHRLAAEAIESLYGDDLEDQLVALGRHWRRAGKIDHARRYFLAGARKAVARYAHEEAIRLYRVYFKLSPDPTPESIVVRYEFARDVLETKNRHQDARQEYIRVLTEAQKLGDRATEALGFLGLGRAHLAMQQPEDARTFWEEGLLAARESKNLPTEGLLLGSLGYLHAYHGRSDVAWSLYTHALTIARQTQNRQEESRLLAEMAEWKILDGPNVDKKVR